MIKDLFDRPVRDLMRKSLYILDENKSVKEAAVTIKENGVGSVLVRRGEDIVGIVTERDILYRVVARGLDPNKVAVRNIMSSPVKTISADTKVREAMGIMGKGGFRRLLVVEGVRPVGVLTMKQIVGDEAKRSFPLGEVKEPSSWLQRHIFEVTEEALKRQEEL